MIFIKNGTINTITNGSIKGDILVENKKIKAIGENLEVPSAIRLKLSATSRNSSCPLISRRFS